MQTKNNSAYLIITGDFVRTGGMDRANFALANYLARKGTLVNLVAHRVANELLACPNVKFHSVPKLGNSYLFSSPLLDWQGRSWAHRLAVNGARVIVNGGNCQWGDINWVHYVHAAYQPKTQLGWLRTGKAVISRRIFLQTERQALQSAQMIIVNSDQTKEILGDKLGIPAKKLHRIYYGIDPQVFYPPTMAERRLIRQRLGWAEDKKVVVFIGALGDRRKGFDILLAAWKNLCTFSNWDADLFVIGAGAELTKWQHCAMVSGVGSRIHFLGFRDDVPDLLRAADCLVSPTRYEAYGLAVQEALCCGLPSLVSATAGVAERYPVQLQELLIPDVEDVGDLVGRLQKWQQSSEYYRQLVIPLANELRKYTWDDMAENIIELINKGN